MADEVLFAGGRLDSVGISGTPVEVTTASRFNSTYADSAVSLSTTDILTATFMTPSGGAMAATDVVTGETLYVHMDYCQQIATIVNNQNWITLYDSSGFPWLAMRTNSTSFSVGVYYNSGTGASPVWTQVGSSFVPAVSLTLFTLDIKLTLGSPHTVEITLNGAVQIAATTFTQASLTSLRSVKVNGTNSSTNISFVSQILCTRGITTIGAFVKYARATGAGTNAGWSGAYTDVNAAIGNDATINSAATTGLKQTYAMGDVTVPAGFVIKSVFNFFRAKNNGAAPANIKSVLRSSGADYSSASLTLPAMSTSFNAMGMRYDLDPATSLPWTQAGWNAAEAGFESLT
jgi:hypothetical protein